MLWRLRGLGRRMMTAVVSGAGMMICVNSFGGWLRDDAAAPGQRDAIVRNYRHPADRDQAAQAEAEQQEQCQQR